MTTRAYARIARFYDLLELPFEYGRYRPLRPRVFESAAGRILDAGVGTGRNMPFYPAGRHVIGIDNCPEMLVRAEKRRARLGIDVELLQMDVLNTAFPDRHFDLIVATFLFTVLPERQHLPALRELARICKLNGEIRLLDCTYSRNWLTRFTMQLWAPWARWAFDASFDRHPERYMAQAGLVAVREQFVFRDSIKLVVARPSAAQA